MPIKGLDGLLRTSLDLELDLQVSRTRQARLDQELHVLRELKAQLEKARQQGQRELPAWVREDERFRLLLKQAEKQVSWTSSTRAWGGWGGGSASSRSHVSSSDPRGAAAGEAGGEDAEGGGEGRPQDPGPEPQRGPRGADLQVRAPSPVRKRALPFRRHGNPPTHLLLLCFQREDGLLHTGKEQHPQPAG